MRTTGLAVICIAVLCITLTLDLWPFHAPRNEVAWLGNHDGLRFGRYSTVFSSSTFKSTSPNGAGDSLDIWLQPGFIWDSNSSWRFTARKIQVNSLCNQSRTDLLLQTVGQDDQYPPKTAKFYIAQIAQVFRKSRPVFITITSGERGSVVYLDGVPVKKTPQCRLSTKAFTGRLIVGDSPGKAIVGSWFGRLFGLAIYQQELTDPLAPTLARIFPGLPFSAPPHQ